MASTTLTSDLPTLAPTSDARHSLVNSVSFAPSNTGYPQGDYYNDPDVALTSRPNMSFSVGQNQRDGYMSQSSGSFRQFDGNGASYNRGNPAPQIYSAVYSGVNVYEMEVNSIAVMRRRADSWLNATQILKVAGIEKGKRTKVLEKEILIGEHEKVQGGYGKYQGTWIKFERGLEFCRQYGVEDILRPLLTYDMGQDGGIAGSGSIETPTKEQAMAAQRKRMYNSGMDNRQNGSGTPSFFKNISSTASSAVAAINKARFDSPAPRGRNGSVSARPPNFDRRPSQQHPGQDYPGGSQQSMQSYASADTFTMNGQDSAYQSAPHYSQHGHDDVESQEPPRKRIRPSSSRAESHQGTNGQYYDTSMREATPTEPSESFMYQPNMQQQVEDNTDPSLPTLVSSNTSALSKKKILMSLFTDSTRSDFANHEVFRTMSPADLDMPIDASAHTVLHWAATLARIPLLKALIQHGASIFRINGAGETALMRACVVTNNLEMGTFGDVLDLLGPTIELRDTRGRTLLHHIAITSAVKGRSQASKYYLESLFEFVVRQGSAPNSQQSLQTNAPQSRSIGLGRFISEVVNVQDRSGDTALNIAARIGNRSIISQLLDVGADATLSNRSNLCPLDFHVGDPSDAAGRAMNGLVSPDKPNKEPREDSGEIINVINDILSQSKAEFVQELNSKQSVIDTIHTKLRDSSALLGEERRRLDTLQSRARIREERRLKVSNLMRATEDEQNRYTGNLHRYGQPMSMTTPALKIGDADTSFALPALLLEGETSELLMSRQVQQDPNQRQLLASLPSAAVLRHRLAAYTTNNEALDSNVRALKRKSAELATTYRKIIGICTKTEESKVDEVIEGLLRAVESERGDVEIGRVREFLSRVEEGE